MRALSPGLPDGAGAGAGAGAGGWGMGDGLRNHIKIQSDEQTLWALVAAPRASWIFIAIYSNLWLSVLKQQNERNSTYLRSQIVSQMNNFKFSHSINCCWDVSKLLVRHFVVCPLFFGR